MEGWNGPGRAFPNRSHNGNGGAFGPIGTVSLAVYNSAAYQPGIPPPKNYDFDMAVPVLESGRFGVAVDKYWGITVDSSNTVYISNRTSHDVITINPEYGPIPQMRIGPLTSHAMQKALFRPTGVTFDKVGNRLIVADKDNHRVVFFTKDGAFISSFGGTGFTNGKLSYPWDVDVSPDGNRIAVSDSRNHRIQIFDKFGNFVNKFSMVEKCPYNFREFFDYPRGVTYDNQGSNLYVTDFNNQSIHRIDTQTMLSSKLMLERDLLRPQGITVDNQGNLVVCDTKRNCVRVISEFAEDLHTINRVGGRRFNTPTDVNFLPNGDMMTIDVDGKVAVM